MSNSNEEKAPLDQVFYEDFQILVDHAYSKDQPPSGKTNPSKKFRKYVRDAPSHGLKKIMEPFITYCTSLYSKHQKAMKEGEDNWIIDEPVVFKVNDKIHLPLGKIYSSLGEEDAMTDTLFGDIMRCLTHVCSEEDKAVFSALAGEKDKKAAGKGFDKLGSLMSNLMGDGSGLGDIFSSVMKEIQNSDLLTSDPNNIDAGKIGEIVKKMMDKANDPAFAAQMQNNPALKKMREFLPKH